MSTPSPSIRPAQYFLGEIHSVFQRRDEGDVASAMAREKIVTVEAAKVILHRQPGAAEIGFVFALVFANATSHHRHYRDFFRKTAMNLSPHLRCEEEAH